MPPEARAARARIVLATGNAGKVREFRQLLARHAVEVLGLDGLPAVAFPPEGDDYAANARAKARAAAETLGLPALADDSGLEVDALGGRPGPRSARYGGPGLDDAGRVAKLLAELSAVADADRTARFVCVAALAVPGGDIRTARATCEGTIRNAVRGAGGFGYDPVFQLADGRTMAELAPDEKNRVSHRAQAVAALGEAIRTLVERAP